MAMTLEESYRALSLQPTASLDEVKKAFRRLAFKLHPDLNPGDDDAARQFRQVNEAYVLLKRQLEHAPRSGGNGSSGGGGPTDGAGPYGQYREQGRRSRTMGAAFGKKGASSGFYYRQEEVLNDILKDPFARQVFEDIYRQTQKKADAGGEMADPVRQRKLSVEWGKNRVTVDLTKGLWPTVKGWLRSHLDDTQTIHLPPRLLVPGAAIRIQLKQGFSETDTISLDVRLPRDFVVGRPVRLRGLGRRLGPWKGDLYLRLLAR